MKIAGVFIFISVLQVTLPARDSLVKLKDNGYEDIIIAIHPKIPENGKLIERIKKMVTDASTYMLQATENRVFIKSAKILIPNTWSTSSTFGRLKTESYDKADVIIADPLIDRDFPYTLQYGGCGEKGKYIHLTPNFILNDNFLKIYGQRGRLFVHEWAHLRWGVFDEYNNEIPFYHSKLGKVEATRCPLSMSGLNKIDEYNPLENKFVKLDCKTDNVTGLYEEDCQFYPNLEPNLHESIMYGQALDPVHAFCNENSHNKEAPNPQNRLCNQQSTWEVIKKSPDISQSAPLPDSNISPPTFSLLQYKDRVVTLVLDVSGSMRQFDRISRMYQASEVYIMQIVESGSSVGIVVFSTDAKIMTQPVKIVDTFQREQLKKFLPNNASGDTNICAGVRKGFEVNKAIDGNTYGTEIVLLTDGEDGGISKCFNEVKNSGAIIHTLALGNSTDKGLERLSSMTGGLQLYASDQVDANGLIDSFSGIKSSSGDDIQQSIQIESTASKIQQNQCLTGKVTIDNTVGNNTFFLATWTSTIPNIKLTDPKGKAYINDQFVSDPISKSARLMIPGTAERGAWEYSLCNAHPADQILGLTVNSRAANPDVPPIVADTYMSSDTSRYPSPLIVYATVTQGFTPVIGVKVTAFIEAQNGKVITLPLLDNGAGADIIKNDGIYSRYFTEYQGNGRHNLKVRVDNKGKDEKVAIPSSRALYLPGYVENGTIISNPPKPKPTSETQNFGDFSRTSTGGAFSISDVPENKMDVFKPSKITDLVAVIEGQKVMLFWTATGEDLDQGNASSYDLRMAFNSQVLDNFENGTAINISSLTPLSAGSREQFSFTPDHITIQNGTVFYFKLVAIDKSNQKSEPSNLVWAALFLPPPPPPTPKTGNSGNGISRTMSTLLLTVIATLTALHV
ncbi:calcium-activated chloride channel regulator 1-like [Pseudophryne corroboree]|uniref:calcium-activated chloride channel regulator 1-like n=1 Tax=Pseudophryne corroboree TaxID=495146 RepID=UPI0030814E4D